MNSGKPSGMQKPAGDHFAPTAVTITATLHLVAVVAVAVVGLVSNDPAGDRLRSPTIAVVYGVPAVLALSSRRRRPLLLAAGVSALLLAVVPVSVQTFVLGPLAVVYLLSFARRTGARSLDVRSALVGAIACPGLVLGAFVVPLLHQDPVCYTQRPSGIERREAPPGGISTGVIPAESDIIQQGCTSDTVAGWEAAAALVLAGLAPVLGVRLLKPASSEPPCATA